MGPTTSRWAQRLLQHHTSDLLDRIPGGGGAVESFAGVGYFFDLADCKPGERVLDLGCGRGASGAGRHRHQGRVAARLVCDPDLLASCIGGAAQLDAYPEAIEAAGCRVELMKRNPYEFLSGNARGASATHGVRSVSLLARKVT